VLLLQEACQQVACCDAASQHAVWHDAIIGCAVAWLHNSHWASKIRPINSWWNWQAASLWLHWLSAVCNHLSVAHCLRNLEGRTSPV